MANNALDNAAGTVFVDYVRKARPNMREASILQGEHWRIGILTESLIRLNGQIPANSKTISRRWWSTAILAPIRNSQ